MTVASAGPYASMHLTPDRYKHASTPPLSFYRPVAIPATQPTASKHRRQKSNTLHGQYTPNKIIWSQRNIKLFQSNIRRKTANCISMFVWRDAQIRSKTTVPRNYHSPAMQISPGRHITVLTCKLLQIQATVSCVYYVTVWSQISIL